jgi:hypothetical protein
LAAVLSQFHVGGRVNIFVLLLLTDIFCRIVPEIETLILEIAKKNPSNATI